MKSTQVLTGLDAVRHSPTRAVITVGVFDGVHVAHQQLVRSTVRLGHRLKGTSIVVTFDPDPRVVLDPAHAQLALMPLEARVSHLKALGVDWIWVIPFTKQFARMTAAQFVRRILIGRLRAVALVVGEAFVFGRDRRGDTEVLRAMGLPHGMQVIPVGSITRSGEPVSSSRVRQLVSDGKLAQAKRLLGRAPALYGIVVRGIGRGRRLGFPTANIRLIPQVLPPQGVYAVLVQDAKGRKAWRGVMNLGVRPTFGPGPLACEVHLLGFSGTLLGEPVSVSLLARLRRERCFSSPEALSRQVRWDLARARRIFARYPG